MKRRILEDLVQWKEKRDRKPLILSGARQVGKTYILQEFGKKCFNKFHYINFEHDEKVSTIFNSKMDPQKIINDLRLYLNTPIDILNDLIIFDEIQQCDKALTSLKYFEENMPELHLCCAGSLIGIHTSESSFPVGKVDLLKMYPLSFDEFLTGCGDERYSEFLKNVTLTDGISELIHAELWDKLKIYFVVGGMPEVVKKFDENKDDLYSAFQVTRQAQDTLINTYTADFAKHSGKENAMYLERMWKNIPSQLAQEQDGSAPKFKFKGIIPGVKSYLRLMGPIDWLEKAGLAIKVPIAHSAQIPLSAYTKENFFKLYVFDVGILGAISHLSPKTILDYNYGSYKGYFAENFVAQELLNYNQHPFYCWREGSAEVEFLIEHNGDTIPIEVKSGWVTQSKSLRVFAQKYNPKFSVIMSAKNISTNSRSKIHNYPLYLTSRFEEILGAGEFNI